MRYQTSSIRKKAKPTTAAAARTNRGEAATRAPGGLGSSFAAERGFAGPSERASAAATTAIRRLARLASQRVRCVPNVSSMKNVVAMQPATAPIVFTP
jgi:hypothetical protein